MYSGLGQIQKKIMLGDFAPHTPQRGFYPQAPDVFEMNPSSQLVIGYHSGIAVPSSLRMLNTKSTSQTLTKTNKKTHELKHLIIAHLFGRYFF